MPNRILHGDISSDARNGDWTYNVLGNYLVKHFILLLFYCPFYYAIFRESSLRKCQFTQMDNCIPHWYGSQYEGLQLQDDERWFEAKLHHAPTY